MDKVRTIAPFKRSIYSYGEPNTDKNYRSTRFGVIYCTVLRAKRILYLFSAALASQTEKVSESKRDAAIRDFIMNCQIRWATARRKDQESIGNILRAQKLFV
jgi:hypothetical protein